MQQELGDRPHLPVRRGCTSASRLFLALPLAAVQQIVSEEPQAEAL
jgi:hypothetical protein